MDKGQTGKYRYLTDVLTGEYGRNQLCTGQTGKLYWMTSEQWPKHALSERKQQVQKSEDGTYLQSLGNRAERSRCPAEMTKSRKVREDEVTRHRANPCLISWTRDVSAGVYTRGVTRLSANPRLISWTRDVSGGVYTRGVTKSPDFIGVQKETNASKRLQTASQNLKSYTLFLIDQ